MCVFEVWLVGSFRFVRSFVSFRSFVLSFVSFRLFVRFVCFISFVRSLTNKSDAWLGNEEGTDSVRTLRKGSILVCRGSRNTKFMIKFQYHC